MKIPKYLISYPSAEPGGVEFEEFYLVRTRSPFMFWYWSIQPNNTSVAAGRCWPAVVDASQKKLAVLHDYALTVAREDTDWDNFSITPNITLDPSYQPPAYIMLTSMNTNDQYILETEGPRLWTVGEFCGCVDIRLCLGWGANMSLTEVKPALAAVQAWFLSYADAE